MKTTSCALLVISAGGCWPQGVRAEETRYETTGEWIAPRGASERLFGKCVAIDRQWIAIATDRGEDGTFDPGSIRLYETDDPRKRPAGLLRAPDRRWPDEFGSAMAFDGNQLLVGAPGDSEVDWDRGAVWLFEHTDGWELTGALTATELEAGDRFGDSVAIADSWAAVGAPRSDRSGLDSGAVHLFNEDGGTWDETEVVVAPDGAMADFFGDCVALSKTWLAVGAWGDDDHGEKTGSVWLFQRDEEGWQPMQKIVPREAGARDRFGCALALSDGWLLVGSTGWNQNQGAIYAFRLEGSEWRLTRQLTARGGRAEEWLGFSLAMEKGMAVAGAPGRREDTLLEGGIDLFELKEGRWRWSQGVRPSGADWGQPNQFGWSVATDGRRIMVGRIDEADGRPEPGRAWLVETSDRQPEIAKLSSMPKVNE